jgi:hypothetical protein
MERKRHPGLHIGADCSPHFASLNAGYMLKIVAIGEKND